MQYLMKKARDLFYLHIKALVAGVMIVFGGVSAWVVYSYLFIPYEAEQEFDQALEVKAHTKGFDRVSAWSAQKQKDAATLPQIRSNVFSLPLTP